MLLSMTGFGKAAGSFRDKNISIEMRSLNSKVFDLRMKVPPNFKEKELELRRIISEKVERGKVDVTVTVTSMTGDGGGFAINLPLFKRYCRELKSISEEYDLKSSDIIQSALRMPDVIMLDETEVNEDEWKVIENCLNDALTQFISFRKREGEAMEKVLSNHIIAINQNLDALQPFENERITKVRQRMYQNLEEFLGRENVDKNRYEQEVLFYLEKIDISEEKVRLAQHCKYFLEELKKTNILHKGRTLSFISQEIGREINTLGAKAYDAEVQHYVVRMKDELEKIKEMLANVA